MKNKIKVMILASVSLMVLGGVGLYYNHHAEASSPDENTAPAMPVISEVVRVQPVQIWKSFSARLEAVDFARIRPQVSGVITEIRFEDGQQVKKGDILYVIDPRPYQAAVNQAVAELNVAKTEADFAYKEFKRAQGLIKTNAISKRRYDERVSANNMARAAVEAIRARVERAQIDLDYAYVKAPVDGRISRAEITEGNLVEAGPNAPLLTSIVSDHGIYADFEVDEKTYLEYIRTIAKTQAAEKKIPVKLALKGDGSAYEGFVHSFDNQIDVSSGTIRARALLANKDGALLPGMFATVKLAGPAVKNQIIISERAIGTNQDRKFVYVVDENNTTTYREVMIGESVNGSRVITDGLSAGDRVITDGIIRIRPGMVVAPQSEKPNKT